VPWDYVYQYITFGWETWGNNFVRRFVDQAWSRPPLPFAQAGGLLDGGILV
jgi:hypothetical protein